MPARILFWVFSSFFAFMAFVDLFTEVAPDAYPLIIGFMVFFGFLAVMEKLYAIEKRLDKTEKE